jgi:tRNA C32,U32 (ribose-2'-O)-methylase TrmJ
MYAKLEAALGRIGFLHAQNAGHMMRTFRRVLGRAALDDREARVFLGVARQVEWYAARGGAPAALTGERRAASGTHASRRARAARRPESIRSRVVVARPDNWGAPG